MADGATLPVKYQNTRVALATSAKLDEAFKDQFGRASEVHKLALKRELLSMWHQAGDRMEKVTAHLVERFISSVQAKGLEAKLVCNGRGLAVRHKDFLDAIMADKAKAGLPIFEDRAPPKDTRPWLVKPEKDHAT